MAYTCATCGTYVPDGTIHSCMGWKFPAPGSTSYTPTYTGPWVDNAALQRLAAAAERIAAALEKSPQIVTATTLKPLKLKAGRLRKATVTAKDIRRKARS